MRVFLLLAVCRILFCADHNVPAGGDLQAAISKAAIGDTITLEAGATFTGNFTLPVPQLPPADRDDESDYVTIRSSQMAKLPEGERVTPEAAKWMPRIYAANVNPAIKFANAAHHWRIQGVEISSPGYFSYVLVEIGSGAETSLTQLPYSIVLDRVYIHGDPAIGGKRGVALNSKDTAIANSYISDIKSRDYETQAILGWNGPGPFTIANNYLEASGENVMFGGAAANIPNLIPSDIVISRNHFFKPLSWRIDDPSYAGTPWMVKNILEFKNGQRITIKGNHFENNWPHAQSGCAILLTPRTVSGANEWVTASDIEFANNLVTNVQCGFSILGKDDKGQGGQGVHRINIHNNYFEQVKGRWMQVQQGPDNITIDHNTIFQGDVVILFEHLPVQKFVYTNNITGTPTYGIIGSGTAEGKATFDKWTPGYVVAGNVFAAATATQYPPDNHFPVDIHDVMFANRDCGDYRLDEASPYAELGTDGYDIGGALPPRAGCITVPPPSIGDGGGGCCCANPPRKRKPR